MTSVFENLGCLNNIHIENSKFLLVDGTEIEIPLSIGRCNLFYGRKKMFSVKTQVIVNPFNMKVVSIEIYPESIL